MNKCINNTIEQGFTLIEVMVSALLLAIGLLGLGALQTTGLKYTYSANLRAKAVLLAYDMADRMRANSANIGNNVFDPNYNGVSTSGTYADQHCNQDTVGQNGAVANCTPTQMVANDAFLWTEDVKKLPSGTGSVAQNAVDNLKYDITLTWKDKSTGNSTSSFTLSVRP